MKSETNKYRLYRISIIILGLIFLGTTYSHAKDKIRLSVEYHHIMDVEAYLSIEGKYKVEKNYVPAQHTQINVYQEISEDSILLIGQCTTALDGSAKFYLPTEASAGADSIIEVKYLIKVEDDAKFKDAKKGVSFSLSYLEGEVITEDSLVYVRAHLSDIYGAPLEGVKLQIQVQRLFAPLEIGKSLKTDEDGNIELLIEDPLPGHEGVLMFEVVADSRSYGQLTRIIEAKVGKEIIDISTFDQRTMWSPPNKTPWFILIFPNLIILGIWFVIFLLVRNLYLISKS